MLDMSVTVETSQFPIKPFGPLALSPADDIMTHITIASSNFSVLSALNTVVEGILSAGEGEGRIWFECGD